MVYYSILLTIHGDVMLTICYSIDCGVKQHGSKYMQHCSVAQASRGQLYSDTK